MFKQGIGWRNRWCLTDQLAWWFHKMLQSLMSSCSIQLLTQSSTIPSHGVILNSNTDALLIEHCSLEALHLAGRHCSTAVLNAGDWTACSSSLPAPISHMAEGTLWLTELLTYTPLTSPPPTSITTNRNLCQIWSCPPLLYFPCLKWYKLGEKKTTGTPKGSHTLALDSPTVMNHQTAWTRGSKSRLCQSFRFSTSLSTFCFSLQRQHCILPVPKLRQQLILFTPVRSTTTIKQQTTTENCGNHITQPKSQSFYPWLASLQKLDFSKYCIYWWKHSILIQCFKWYSMQN